METIVNTNDFPPMS